MTDLNMPTLRQARPEDWPMIESLLNESGLPVKDLGKDKLDDFLVAEDGPDLMGLIGLELYETIGLLRSLVVARNARRLGLGGKLVGALESAAQAAGITELWLLTIDAERFFQSHGFEIIERTAVPEVIRGTDEFGDLCPDTAFLMAKSLR